MKLKFRPIYGNMLIDYESQMPEKTEGGIILTDYARERPQQGVIVAIGEGYRSKKTGERLPPSVKIGDEVKFKSGAGVDITVEGKDYFLMQEGDIEGIIEKDEQGKR